MQPRRRRAAEAPCPLAPLRRARWHLYAVPVAPLRRAELPGCGGAAPRWYARRIDWGGAAEIDISGVSAPRNPARANLDAGPLRVGAGICSGDRRRPQRGPSGADRRWPQRGLSGPI